MFRPQSPRHGRTISRAVNALTETDGILVLSDDATVPSGAGSAAAGAAVANVDPKTNASVSEVFVPGLVNIALSLVSVRPLRAVNNALAARRKLVSERCLL